MASLSGLVACLLLAVLLLSECVSVAAEAMQLLGKWKMVAPQKVTPDPYDPALEQPAIRYSHSAAMCVEQCLDV